MQKIVPFLWFNGQAEEAVRFYTSIFQNSGKKDEINYFEENAEIARKPAGLVMSIPFQLNGQDFIALNGGPEFKLTEAISFIIQCESQTEIDFYWEKLSVGGDPNAQQCGWLKDKFGLSWQIIPANLNQMLQSEDAVIAGKIMGSILKMKKINLNELENIQKGKDE